MNDIIYQKWDSDFLGLSVGKLLIENNNFTFTKEVKNKLTQFELVYIFSEELLNVDESSAFKLVDQKITFSCYLEGLEYYSNPNIIKTSLLTSRLEQLSLQSGLHSRFKDENFESGCFERIYNEWIVKSLKGEFDDCVYSYIEEDTLGFFSYKNCGSWSKIGLIAVDETQRGRGIGTKLISKAKSVAKEEGLNEIRVSTQLNNTLACSFYLKNGFVMIDKVNIYHFWTKNCR